MCKSEHLMKYKAVLTIEELEAYIDDVFPEAKKYNFKIIKMSDGNIEVSMDVSKKDLRPGGTVSGPAMFALVDVSAYYLVLAHIGKVALAVTTNLSMNFLNKPTPDGLKAVAKLQKLGKRLVVCNVELFSGKDETLVADASVTYSVPPRN